ncbi:zinc finger protein 16-like isoform X1 [Ochlerotatus camptorhynchus]|uniref:zinc finger protein 16-like isoform X1 n=1 Tax=Ochlerotatus camptorhynchus TaxID=644619 RepID=UPI0031E31C4F
MEVMDMNFEYDLSRICRSCRMECQELHPIFDSIGSSGVPLHEMMSVCTQLQIHYNDGMPRNLCSPCVTDINTSYSFRKRCEQSDMMLREYISRKKQDGSGADGGNAVKVELFDIKPEITFIDADPLIGEKCFAVSIQDGRGVEGIEGNPEEGLIEALDDDDDMIQAEFVDNSDRDSDMDYDGGSLDDLIEEVDTEGEEEKPRTRQTRGRKGHGFTKIKGGTLACDSCERVFLDKRGIANHVKQHEPKPMKECSTCERNFSSSYHLSRHMKIHEMEVQCEHCDRRFSAAVYDEYRQHMEQEHPGIELLPERKIEDDKEQESDKPFRCKICHTGFNRRTHLTRHMIGHGSVKRFECAVCQRKFHRKDNLQSHLKTHGKPRVKRIKSQTQQNAGQCAKVDKQIEDTKEGILVNKAKPQTKLCSICGQCFGRSYHLNRHMRLHAVKPDFSKKTKITKRVITGLKMRRPTGSIKSVQCSICDKWFGRSYHLKRHMKLHETLCADVDPEENKQKFEKSGLELALTLTADMVEEQGKMEAICRICDSSFDRIAQLRSHLRSHVDPESFADANIHTKPYLFEEGYVLENYLDYLVQQVCKWDVLRFYQIVEPDGEELELSDSDSEPEEANQPVEGIVRREHVCALCSESFPRIKTIMDHARDQHRPEDLIGCRHCSRGFPSTELLVRHLKQQCENHHKKFFCTFCNEKFMWQTSLNKHAQCKHKPTKPLWDKTELSGTGETDDKEKKFVCQVCSRGFQRLEHLERHIKIHIPSEKKFECTQCHKKFNRKDNLRSHMKIHKKDPEEEMANKQTHLCVYCGRGFSNSSNLIVHMRRHTGERPYKCDICDKGFPRSSDLQCHRRTHTGEKPCLCTICGKGFSRSNKLVRHMRIHTGARPYSCTYCDRAFTQSNDLTLHIRRHTGEKPYVCGICNERFIQGTALKAHQRVTGHYDDGSSQPERFASISVNNPNRLGINGPKAVRQSPGTTSDDLPKVVKPVKSRKKANPSGSKPSTSVAPPPPSESSATVTSSKSITVLPASAVFSAPASPGESSIKAPPSSLHGLPGAPHGYVPMPYIMPSYDLASTGLFSQNFSQQQ